MRTGLGGGDTGDDCPLFTGEEQDVGVVYLAVLLEEAVADAICYTEHCREEEMGAYQVIAALKRQVVSHLNLMIDDKAVSRFETYLEAFQGYDDEEGDDEEGDDEEGDDEEGDDEEGDDEECEDGNTTDVWDTLPAPELTNRPEPHYPTENGECQCRLCQDIRRVVTNVWPNFIPTTLVQRLLYDAISRTEDRFRVAQVQ